MEEPWILCYKEHDKATLLNFTCFISLLQPGLNDMKQRIPKIPGLTWAPPLVFWASGVHPMDNHITLLPRDTYTLTSSQNELLKVTDSI